GNDRAPGSSETLLPEPLARFEPKAPGDAVVLQNVNVIADDHARADPLRIELLGLVVPQPVRGSDVALPARADGERRPTISRSRKRSSSRIVRDALARAACPFRAQGTRRRRCPAECKCDRRRSRPSRPAAD